MRTRTILAAAAVLAVAGPAAAQSTLDRTPDLSGGWVGAPGRLHFHFLHRFEAGPAPSRKVTNTPTFLVGVGLPGHVLVGAHYATNSTVAAGRPNEWELFGRWAPLGGPADPAGGPSGLLSAVQAGYNQGASSVDGEVTLGVARGRFRVFGVGRGFTGWRDTDSLRFAVGGGALVRLTPGIALAADVVTPLDAAADEDPAWSAGLQLRLPYTPHTLSFQVSNAITTTLQGSSFGSGTVRYGFEFTIPVTLSRYLPRRSAEPAMADTAMAAGVMSMATADTVEIHIKDLKYGMERLEVTPGTTVVWVNDDPVTHSSTSDDGVWDSDLIMPGQRWARTFNDTGTYAYHCTPHPFMHGVVVVRAGMEGM